MIPRLLCHRGATRRAEVAALEAEARAARIERYRRAGDFYRQQSAFEDALDQFATEQPTRVVLDGYLDDVTA